MESLFDKWKIRIPKYSERHKELFEALSQKYGAEGEKKISLGKHFSSNYELYMFAFFLGLYNDKLVPIPKEEKRIDFSHHIQFWGSKSTVSSRKDFTNLQENIFIALMAKSNIDLIELDKGILSEEVALKELITTMESYTNGGLIMIRELLDSNSDFFLRSTSFLDLILE